jgi:hypothetical protein
VILNLTVSVDSGVATGTYNLQVQGHLGEPHQDGEPEPHGDGVGWGEVAAVGAGTTWTLRNLGNPLYGVTYGNGLFVAVGC